MVQCDFTSKINFSKEVERTIDTTLQFRSLAFLLLPTEEIDLSLLLTDN